MLNSYEAHADTRATHAFSTAARRPMSYEGSTKYYRTTTVHRRRRGDARARRAARFSVLALARNCAPGRQRVVHGSICRRAGQVSLQNHLSQEWY